MNRREDVTADEVIRQWGEGRPLSQIARNLECSVDTIKSRLWSVGVSNTDMFHKGYLVTWNGYVKKRVTGHPRADSKGYVAAHTLVMEEHMGRYLTDNEIVHHVDFNRHNNEIQNLVVMDREEHRSMHSPIVS